MTQQSTPGPTFRKDENPNSKRHIHLNVHCCTIYNSQDIEAICVQRQMNALEGLMLNLKLQYFGHLK